MRGLKLNSDSSKDADYRKKKSEKEFVFTFCRQNLTAIIVESSDNVNI